MSNEAPIFVTGMPRSGTTLMSAMLSAHPGIVIAPETHFLSEFMLGETGEEPADFEVFWTAFAGSRRFADLGIEAEAVAKVLREAPDRSFRRIFATVLEAYAEPTGRSRWGEKTPAHERHMDTLLDWFPDARIVYMLRDPRAVVSSMMQTPWSRGTVEELARRWQNSVDRARAFPRAECVRIVRYEDLVREPEGELREVCRFLSEDWSPRMLDFAESAGDLVAGQSWKENVRRPLTTDSITKWKTRLSRKDVALIEHFDVTGMTAYGYVLEAGGLGTIRRVGILVRRVLRRVRRKWERHDRNG